MDSERASFERCQREGHSTLVVAGEIDMANAPRLLQELMAVAAAAHSPALVDLSAVTFFDSSGVNALVSARRSLEDTDVSLVLVNPSQACRRVFEITGLDTVFEVADSNQRS